MIIFFQKIPVFQFRITQRRSGRRRATDYEEEKDECDPLALYADRGDIINGNMRGECWCCYMVLIYLRSRRGLKLKWKV